PPVRFAATVNRHSGPPVSIELRPSWDLSALHRPARPPGPGRAERARDGRRPHPCLRPCRARLAAAASWPARHAQAEGKLMAFKFGDSAGLIDDPSEGAFVVTEVHSDGRVGLMPARWITADPGELEPLQSGSETPPPVPAPTGTPAGPLGGCGPPF